MVCTVAIFIAYPFCMYILPTVRKMLCANIPHIAQTSPNHVFAQMQNAKIRLSCGYFENFGQDALFDLGKMLLHIRMASNLNIMATKSC